MRNLAKFIQNTNTQHHLWQRGDCIIVGVSGGVDSMSLLHLFLSLSKKENLSLIVAHVNYKLRGLESENDQKRVEIFCKKNNIIFEVLLAKRSIEQNENVWRKQRYDFFYNLLKKHDAQKIALAHNKNDQAETVLMHLLRGSGALGLSAMPYEHKSIIRPFLNVQKEDILIYAKEHEIPYTDDQTNNDTKFTRNRVRHELIPYLQENFNPNIVSTLSQTAIILAQYDTLFEEIIEKQISYKESTDKIVFGAHDFLLLHDVSQKMFLRKIINHLSSNIQQPSFGIISQWISLIKSIKNKTQIMPYKGLKITKKGDTVEITRLK